MSNYQTLRALAEAATPGPWKTDGDDLVNLTDSGKGYPIDRYPDSVDIIIGQCPDCGDRGVGIMQESNAAYIAAVHPGAVLALLDEIEQLRARKDRVRHWKQETSTAMVRAATADLYEREHRRVQEMEIALRLARARVAELADLIATGARNLGIATMERDQARAEVKRLNGVLDLVREVLGSWSDLSKAHEYGCGNNRPCDACDLTEAIAVVK